MRQPSLDWYTALNGQGNEHSTAIRTFGNFIYVAGLSTDTTPGSLGVVVSKLDRTKLDAGKGSGAVVWETRYGLDYKDDGLYASNWASPSIDLDSAGNLYLAGRALNPPGGLPIGTQVASANPSGTSPNGFLFKINPTDGSLAWSRLIEPVKGGPFGYTITDIRSIGNYLLVIGSTDEAPSVSTPTGTGIDPFLAIYSNSGDFIGRVNLPLTALNDDCQAVALSASGGLVLVGATRGSKAQSGTPTAFVLSVSPTAGVNFINLADDLQTIGTSAFYAAAIGKDGTVYAVGFHDQPLSPGSNPAARSTAILYGFRPDFSSVTMRTLRSSAGTAGYAGLYNLAIGADDNVYVVGGFEGAEESYPVDASLANSTNSYVAKFSPKLDLIDAFVFPAVGFDEAQDGVFGPDGRFYITGATDSILSDSGAPQPIPDTSYVAALDFSKTTPLPSSGLSFTSVPTLTLAPKPAALVSPTAATLIPLLNPGQDTTAPVTADFSFVSGGSAAQASNSVSLDCDLVIRFSKWLKPGVGQLIIVSADLADVLVLDGFDSKRVQFEGSNLRLKLAGFLKAGKTYYLSQGSSALQDLNGNAFQQSLNLEFSTAASLIQESGGGSSLSSAGARFRVRAEGGSTYLNFSGNAYERQFSSLITTSLSVSAKALVDRYLINRTASSSGLQASFAKATYQDLTIQVGTVKSVSVDVSLTVESKANGYLSINPDSGDAFDFTYDPVTGLGAELLDTNSNGLVDSIRLHLIDGGKGDVDGLVNGTIRHVGALATAPRASVYRFYKNGVHFYTNNTTERDSVISNSYGPGISYDVLIANPTAKSPTSAGWGYRFEGTAYQSLETQGTPLYRFYSPSKAYHFMTTNAEEALTVIRNSVGSGYDLSNASGKPLLANGWGYQFEGTSYRVSKTAQFGMDTPVYRFYNVAKGVHFYSSNLDEVRTVISNSLGSQYANDLGAALKQSTLLPNGWQYRFEGAAWYV